MKVTDKFIGCVRDESVGVVNCWKCAIAVGDVVYSGTDLCSIYPFVGEGNEREVVEGSQKIARVRSDHRFQLSKSRADRTGVIDLSMITDLSGQIMVNIEDPNGYPFGGVDDDIHGGVIDDSAVGLVDKKLFVV